MDGFMPVKVMVPLADYKRLYAEAETSGHTVADLIAQRIARPKTGSATPRIGRPSGYTSRAGEDIAAGRRFGMSWVEISRQVGVSSRTAREWLTKYENEVREQNMRDSAERRAG